MTGAWPLLLPIAYGLSSLLGLACLIRWLIRGGGWTIAQRIAVVLLAGDISGAVLYIKPEWVSYQAGLVLVLVCIEEGRCLVKNRSLYIR